VEHRLVLFDLDFAEAVHTARRPSKNHTTRILGASAMSADIGEGATEVRFTPESGHWLSVSRCPLCAKSGHSALRQKLALFDHLVGTAEQ
jgi:hypothetical protein